LDDNVGTLRRRWLISAAAFLIGLAGIGLAAAFGTAASAAGGAAATPSATSQNGTISEAGSSLLLPLMQKWATAYHQQFPSVTVNTAGGGSSAGISDAATGSTDVGASDAYLSSGDVLVHPGLLNIPLAVSAQSVIFNLPNLQGTNIKLSATVLAEMYSGQITMWNDTQIKALNGGVPLPAIRVVPLHRVEGSGDTFIFTSYLSTQDPAWSTATGYGTLVNWPSIPAAQQVAGSSGMITGCEKTIGCVGYNGVSYLSQEQAGGLGEAALQNGGGRYLTPSPATIQAELEKFIAITPPNETIAMIAGPGGYGYPIINYEYAIVKTVQPAAATAEQIKNFLQWVISSPAATSLVTSVGFQPLPSDVQKLSQAQIEEIH
jgi:phosphate transport system substrate-binding protein